MRSNAVAAAALASSAGLSSFAAAASVEVGTLTTVVVDAPLYDTSTSASNGCDPAGCVGDLTRDGDTTSLESRWSCKPALGSAGATCFINYALAEELPLDALKIAMYEGDTRTRIMDILVDGQKVVTWTSSGTTTDFETVELGITGQTVELQGVLADSEWLSIVETEIMVLLPDDTTPPPSPTTIIPTPAPTSRSTIGTEQEAGDVGTVIATSDLYDTNLSGAGGCDPAGCTADLTRDGDLTEGSRWSCAPNLGGECSISYDLGAVRDLSQLRLAMYKGDTRTRTIEVNVDGTLVTTWTSSGTTSGFESIDLSGVSGSMIEITGVLGNSEWLSIVETEILVLTSDGMTAPPVATPTPTPAPTDTTTTGELQTVGPLPLASTSFAALDNQNLRPTHAVKDGDMSTSWSCSGDPTPDDDRTDCFLTFSMYGFRSIKQVKIALANGASEAITMRIISGFRGSLDPDISMEVTSSGTTLDFETYDFDYFTEYITIEAVFATEGQTLDVAEVEFIEEVQAGEIQLRDFDLPCCNLFTAPIGTGLTFISDSAEVLDASLRLTLNFFAKVTSLLLEFPVGDTYKFDVELYDYEEELVYTQQGLESTDAAGWQSFDIAGGDLIVTSVDIIVKGTGSGAPGFQLLDGRVVGEVVDNPTDTITVASTNLHEWGTPTYPDFVAPGRGDQKAIMGAICAVKKASFDGVDCVGGDESATGTVKMNFGEWFVDGNIFMKSGVTIDARYTQDDFPYTTELTLEEGAAGKTDVPALIVMDGITNAEVESLWVNGRYDPESGSAGVGGLGSLGISIDGSENIRLRDTEVNNIDGDGVLMRNSKSVDIDSGPFDEQYIPWQIHQNSGTGIVMDTSDAVWVRRYDVADNGVAGIHIMGSNNFTFEATIDDQCFYVGCVLEGEGRVGSLDGQQPIEVIVESSTNIKFKDMRVLSANDPVMTVSDSQTVSFENCGFSTVSSGTCVIETDGLSEVATFNDPELALQGTCYIKV